MENRIRVLTVVYATLGEDHGDEMDAGGLEKRKRSILRQQPHVDVRDVADYVVPVVEDGEGRNAFIVHELEGSGERLIAVDGDDGVAADVEVA